MSQWNNSYAYQNQYQGGNTWNEDANAQFVNQSYYPGTQYESSNQYVSFNEFLSQMQSSNAGASAAASYNNVQYPTYEGNQYNYQNMPSSSQNAPDTSFNLNPSSNATNSAESYQVQNQQLAVPDPPINDVAFKSNLTATAVEFVPKSSAVKASSSAQHVKPESSKTRNTKESKSSSSSDTNWRERPQTSGQNGSSRNDYRQNDRFDSSHSYRQDSNNHREPINRSIESSSRSSDANYRNTNSRNFDRNYESNNQNDRYDSRNNERHYDRGQKNGSKSKVSKDERMFYNSSINKNQDRNGREESRRGRNYQGSSRLRAVDRNIVEDEQFASSYLQYREEKAERMANRVKDNKDRDHKDRDNKDNTASPRNKKKPAVEHGEIKEMTQRERLSEQLNKGTLECLVCCDRVKQVDPVWSCSNCYHVLHLRCIRKWATSSLVEGKWRCPACQNTSEEIPTDYRCMCGAVRSPEWSRGAAGAHTCGRGCRRPHVCPHPCPLVCHPGPCPPCTTAVKKPCGCGAETRTVMCSDKTPLVCGRICNRLLECGQHTCQKECHEGACGDCTEIIEQICYCARKEKRVVSCTLSRSGVSAWSCGALCTFVLGCGVHLCRAPCHAPPCQPCALAPSAVTTCPCRHTKLTPGSRQKCTDPIPTCDNICAKPLTCGPPGDKHFCKVTCHNGECPPCPEKTLTICRCGHSTREVLCAELPDLEPVFICQKKCNKKLSCGRHRCRAVCCAEKQHRCGVVCGRSLACQLHRCAQFCHTGHCAPCPRLNFEELTCECGAEVLLPPTPCGTRPPPCAAPCRRPRACAHPPHHSCHSGDCPPCVVLTTKMCHGGHEERKTIPCSQEEFSCGLPCGKPLPCGKHTCIKTCHKGPCDTGKCTQPCTEVRPLCGHPCAAPCHADNGGPCPSAAPCRRTVRATCACARRHAERTCAENAAQRAKILSTLAATKVQEGGTVDLSEMRPSAMLKTLECDDECRVEARTRQLALALQIRNPDVSSKLAPRYSDHVRTTASKEPAFAQQIHDKLTELVQLAKKSVQRTRSHSFPSMNWSRRQFVHELCEQFGCESVAYDAEPNRNVVATASKDKSWLPAMSVLEVLAREAGKRRVPGPVLRAPPNAATHAAAQAGSQAKPSSGWATLTSNNAWASRSQPRPLTSSASDTSTASAPTNKIDYFDNPPDD